MKKSVTHKENVLRIEVPGGGPSLRVMSVVYSSTVGNRSIALVRLEDGRSAFLRNKSGTKDWYLLAVPV